MQQSRTVSQEGLDDLQKKMPGLKYVFRAPARSVSKRPKVGQVAPDFEVKTVDGKTFRLSDQRGKAVLLHFWAPWCVVCVKNTPEVAKLNQELSAGHKQFTMISLSADQDDAPLRRQIEKHKLLWPQTRIGRESQIGSDYGVDAVPEYYLIAPDGIITAEAQTVKGIKAAAAKLLSN